MSYENNVPLEPAFRPFPGHEIARNELLDDGRKHTLFSALIELLRATPRDVAAGPFHPLPSPGLAPAVGPSTELELLVPPNLKIDSDAQTKLLLTLSASAGPLSFELVGNRHEVSIRFACHDADAPLIKRQIQSHYPDICIRAPERPLLRMLADTPRRHLVSLEFGLAAEFMIPLAMTRSQPDPLTPFIGALSGAGSEDAALLQILFEPARAPWREHALRAVLAPDGEPFFADFPDIVALTEEKFESSTFAAVVRVLIATGDAERLDELLRAIGGALGPHGAPNRNALVPLASNNDELAADIAMRTTRRSGMLLSVDELASLARLPGDTVRAKALIRVSEEVRPLPSEVTRDGIEVGSARLGRESVRVRLPEATRLQHVYVIGGSGTGKSTLLQNMIIQDVEGGRGVGVIDPHGDLIDDVLARIPHSRRKDIVLLDPGNTDWVVGWNILGAHSTLEKELLASDLVAVFKRLSTSWGDQMSAVLGNAVLAFLESTRGGTLTDLRRFLLDQTFREEFLQTVQDEHVRSFWKDDFSLLASKKPQAPILTRLDVVLRSKLLRMVVTEKEKPLNFRDIIDSGKIFLAKLSQGAIGEENAALLGSLLVSRFHQVSLGRQDTAIDERRPFFLYLDEFHLMATPSLAGLFSGVRKYRLGLTVAHQNSYQLRHASPEVERAVLANAYTRFIFRVSDEDARQLEKGIGGYTAEDLANLGQGEAVMRVGRQVNAFAIHTKPPTEGSGDHAPSRIEALKRDSLEAFGRKREVAATPAATSPDATITDTPAPTAIPRAPEPGRGSRTHKFLQAFLRDSARGLGFRAEIEWELPNGKRVDVWLVQHELTVACEIAEASTVDQELANLAKSLEAGATHVCSISLDPTFLARLEAAARSQAITAADQIRFLAPQEVVPFLRNISVPSATKRVAGYSVRVRHSSDSLSAGDQRSVITEVMLQSLKRTRMKQ